MTPRLAAATAITAYQRHLSPHKGFRCAHRALHGGWSCSEFGKRAVLRFGVAAMLALLWRRFAKCRHAYFALRAQALEDEHRDKPAADDSMDPWVNTLAWEAAGQTACCIFGGCIPW